MFEAYPEYEYHLASTQLAFAMLGMGATLSVADFVEVFRRPWAMAFGGAVQLLVVPLVAVGFNALWEAPPGIAVGLVLVAAMPGGSLSNLFTFLGLGNAALSIALTGCCTLLCVGTIPMVLRWGASGYLPADFVMPTGQIITETFMRLLVPLAAGMLVAGLAPLYRKVVSKWCIRIALLTLALIVVGSLGSGRIDPAAYGWMTPLAIIAFCVLVQQGCMWPCTRIGLSTPDRLAIGLEVTVRNINLALLLKAALFPAAAGRDSVGDGVLYVVLFYGAVSLFAALPATFRHRRRIRRAQISTDASSGNTT